MIQRILTRVLGNLITVMGVTDMGDEATKEPTRGFPGGAVIKNPPANAGEMGSSPGGGRSHMPRSN